MYHVNNIQSPKMGNLDIFLGGTSDILGYLYADQIKIFIIPISFSEAENLSVHTEYLLYPYTTFLEK